MFCNTLVDRIVPGAVPADETAGISEKLGYRDGLLTACEPYALFAIEETRDCAVVLGLSAPMNVS